MHLHFTRLTTLSAALFLVSAAQAAEAPYYNPANAANSNGKTSGYELYKTIGCPGRGILETPCQAPTAPAPAPAPLDSDRDGVIDSLDQCPTTPAGRKVNAVGCELDTDGDGVLDSLDKCPATPQGDRVDNVGCTLLSTIVLKGVNFDNNADLIRADAVPVLDEAVALLKRYPGIKVEVAGHTDSQSDDAHNQQLSERRAKAVMGYFVDKGVAADSLSAKGYGETTPIADNATEEGRAVNRRVELRILN